MPRTSIVNIIWQHSLQEQLVPCLHPKSKQHCVTEPICYQNSQNSPNSKVKPNF